jgi:pimeloyl-ACP methyl ester carboxylesterase
MSSPQRHPFLLFALLPLLFAIGCVPPGGGPGLAVPDGIDVVHELDGDGWTFTQGDVVVRFAGLPAGTVALVGVGIEAEPSLPGVYGPIGPEVAIWIAPAEAAGQGAAEPIVVGVSLEFTGARPSAEGSRLVYAVTAAASLAEIDWVDVGFIAAEVIRDQVVPYVNDGLVYLHQLFDAEEPKPGPVVETWYQVDLQRVPALTGPSKNRVVDSDAACDDDAVLANAFLRERVPDQPRDRAIVLVHGWQSLGGYLKRREGDTDLTQAHCTVSLAFASSVVGRSTVADAVRASPWAAVLERSDLYTIRYDSNREVAHGAGVLRAALEALRATYGNEIVVIGHSMGGIVAHETVAASPAWVRGVVTLSSPLWGAPLLCTDVTLDGRSCTAVDGKTVWFVPAIELSYGTSAALSLASAYELAAVEKFADKDPVPGPFMVDLIARSSRYSLVPQWAFSGEMPGLTGFLNQGCDTGIDVIQCKAARQLRSAGWGTTDSTIPTGSSSGVPSFSLEGGAEASPLNRIVVLRDHIGVVQGCKKCTDELASGEFDEYLTLIARAVNDLFETVPVASPTNLYATLVAGEVFSSTVRVATPRFSIAGDFGWSASAPWIRIVSHDGSDLAGSFTIELDASTLTPGLHSGSVDVAWSSTRDGGTPYALSVPVTVGVIGGADAFRLYGTVTTGAGGSLGDTIVSAEVNGVSFAATTDAAGAYDFTFDSGGLAGADVRFARPGYRSTVRAVSFATSALRLDVTLEPIGASEILFFEDFDACASSWRIENAGLDGTPNTADDGMWGCRDEGEIVNEAFIGRFVSPIVGDLTNGRVPPPFSGSRAMWYGSQVPAAATPRSETGNYLGVQSSTDSPGSGGTSASANAGLIVSPRIDLTSVSAARLEGFTWYEVESVDIAVGQYDQMRILVYAGDPKAGGVVRSDTYLNPPVEPELQVPDLPYTTGGQLSPPTWVPFAVDLAPVVGRDDVYIAFFFQTNDRLYNGFRGWLIDHVGVYRGAGPQTATPSGVLPAVPEERPQRDR